MFRKVILTLSAFVLSACGYPDTTLAQAPEYQDQGAALPGPALWQVADEDTVIYLFGTVHFLPQDTEWYTPEIAAALESSEEFVSEIDTSAIPQAVPGEAPPPELLEMAQMQMRLAQLTTGGTLRDLMTEEDRSEYEAALAGIGIPPQALDGFEPWFAIVTISQLGLMQAGMDPAMGAERVLDGLIEGKERAALETVEQQFGFFDSLPMESQLVMLDETVENLDEMAPGLQRMIDEWMAGNPDGLAAMLNEEMADPILREVLLTGRNASWAEWIDERLDQPGTVFIAVGAGHLAGQGSVQDYLADRGIAVQRVQ